MSQSLSNTRSTGVAAPGGGSATVVMGQRVKHGGARDFEHWQVDADMMRLAKPDAVFMHCLPAHRGEEVAAEVIDGPQSVVWDEAENRLHTQKALMEYLLLGKVQV